MHANDSLDALQLHDYQVIDNDVDLVARVKSHAVIDHRKRDLTLNGIAQLNQLVAKTNFIGALKKSWAEGSMYSHRSADYCFCNGINRFFLCATLCPLWLSAH